MSNQRLARLAGLLYALNIAIGIMAMVWANQNRAGAQMLNLIGAAEYAVVVCLLGRLFESAGRGFSWGVAAIGLAACAVSAAMIVHLIALPVGVSPVVVFGPYCICLGALVIRSGLIPRLLGALLIAGGISWLTFASPWLAHVIAPWNMVVGAVPELLLTLWLLAFGVRTEDRATE